MDTEKTPLDAPQQLLPVSGEMATLTLNKDWGLTPVGAIRNWHQSLRTLVNIVLNSKFPMFLFWGPDLICFYNDAYRPSLGENGKHPFILGMKGEEAWTEIWDIIKPLIDQVMNGEGATWSEDQLIPIFRNGKIEDVYWTFSYSPVNDDSGRIGGVLVTCTETTEKVLTQARLEESERRLRSMILQAPVSIGIFRGEDYITEIVNQRALQVWGRKEAEVLNLPILEAMPELKSQGIKALLDDVYKTGKIFSASELPVEIIRNGALETLYLNFSYEPLYSSTGIIEGIMAVATDVTEQVKARKIIEVSEEKFRLLADSVPQHIWTADPKGNLNYFNQSVFEFSGLTLKEIEKNGWIQVIHPDERERNMKAWMEAVETGNDFLFEHRFRRHDGEYRWQLSRARPHRGEGGEIQMWVGTSTDIQDQKIFTDALENEVIERTKELAQNNLELAKINKELQSFAYISSHDLQEPLRKIQTFASQIRIKEEENLSENGKELFRRMQVSAERMQSLIDDLLAYSRTQSSERQFQTINLLTIIENVTLEIKEEIQEKKASIETLKMCEVSVVAFQFQQLFYNLISNSLKFSRPEHPIHITINSEYGMGADLDNEKLKSNTNYCHIRIADNGIGFEPEFNERIFELFQRLHGKTEYPGTGIGLAIVKKIVDNHNGIITAKGELGVGATFDIYLPDLA